MPVVIFTTGTQSQWYVLIHITVMGVFINDGKNNLLIQDIICRTGPKY